MTARPAKPDPDFWYDVYRRLMFGKGRLRRWEIDEMTDADIAMALDQDIETNKPPRGAHASGHENVVAYMEWRRSLTPLQRLHAAREGKL